MSMRPFGFRLLERLRRSRISHRRRSRSVRVLTIIGGVIVTTAGLALLALPGPAFLVIPIGLYLLALEFDWAERLLRRALARADRSKNSSFVQATVRFVKRHPRTTAAILALVLTLIGLLAVSFFRPDWVPQEFKR